MSEANKKLKKTFTATGAYTFILNNADYDQIQVFMTTDDALDGKFDLEWVDEDGDYCPVDGSQFDMVTEGLTSASSGEYGFHVILDGKFPELYVKYTKVTATTAQVKVKAFTTGVTDADSGSAYTEATGTTGTLKGD